ncbi:unnamed protein product [Phytophthora fragariaefolia]|uniref:Unnamed protein product n=1 Tax=Phytophthora fragariaefolia TaxID=1490495 RepID=A0A9W7CZ23_9STRA|nr:unnamed protein product [Phytophthora fragariaefolia]
MFQQMQELVRLNEATQLRETCGLQVSAARGEEMGRASGDVQMEGERRGVGCEQIQRLQAIVVQQANEIETLRRRQRDAIADGRVRHASASGAPNQVESSAGHALQRAIADEVDCTTCITDSDNDDDNHKAPSEYRPAAKEQASQLRRLPLTSLHAQLKRKDLQLLNMQQLVAKLEERLGHLIERKRAMAQSYQQTARAQQAQLKKYLAYIRQQTAEKKALERQVRDLNKYGDVLEKKVLSAAVKSAGMNTNNTSLRKL